jgi:hypothetical protein
MGDLMTVNCWTMWPMIMLKKKKKTQQRTHSLSLSHTLTHSHSHSLSHTHTLSLTLTHTHSHALWHSHSLTHSFLTGTDWSWCAVMKRMSCVSILSLKSIALQTVCMGVASDSFCSTQTQQQLKQQCFHWCQQKVISIRGLSNLSLTLNS